MALELVRIDCRLIHGQILEAWVPTTQAECLVVANDVVAQDKIQRMVMEMAVPSNVEVAILPVKEAALEMRNGRWEHKRVILLLIDSADALALFNAGLKYSRLNIGNLHFSPNKKQITYSVALDSSDLENLDQLNEQGVLIEIQNAPNDPSRSFFEINKIYQDL
ncbi:MAG: PTS sugar transporter subunit IIB [Deltaproteobacteria bacterium]|nr:PTS sugar transporter subunit IIB [Deltaproteobacteria bacterium]MBW2052163.1 PTS sugar transporter subunit IIB [Deltaproteobacteria bacterium]MBW2139671.1 PTS sugar transporter subunit IIB [Deltaproteobacteria bacterium]MBW2322283.1 PTS sugar transporter subunit IIB [Deltaproteobacteria bacterium]